MNRHIGLFHIPKNRPNTNHTRQEVGAAGAMRVPRAAVSCNLIHRTQKGSCNG